jgi:hypothetical protein
MVVSLIFVTGERRSLERAAFDLNRRAVQIDCVNPLYIK